MVILSNEETDRIAQVELTNLLVNDVQRQLDKELVDPELPLGLRNVTVNYATEKDEAERAIEQREMILKLEKEAVSPRAAHPKLRERAQINKRVVEAFEQAVTPEDLAVEKSTPPSCTTGPWNATLPVTPLASTPQRHRHLPLAVWEAGNRF
ncbi:hypothetical protein QPX96_01725 [Limosilactobacillus fermentum]|nr:hypothetical protein [Limosilactobacillus fermentum]